MNWKKAIGFGILIWLIMFALVSAFLPLYDALWMRIILAIVAGIISFILAGYVKPTGVGKALGYGICWVVISIILNAIVTMRFNAVIFSDWTMWLSCILMLLAPMLRVRKAQSA